MGTRWPASRGCATRRSRQATASSSPNLVRPLFHCGARQTHLCRKGRSWPRRQRGLAIPVGACHQRLDGPRCRPRSAPMIQVREDRLHASGRRSLHRRIRRRPRTGVTGQLHAAAKARGATVWRDAQRPTSARGGTLARTSRLPATRTPSNASARGPRARSRCRHRGRPRVHSSHRGEHGAVVAAAS